MMKPIQSRILLSLLLLATGHANAMLFPSQADMDAADEYAKKQAHGGTLDSSQPAAPSATASTSVLTQADINAVTNVVAKELKKLEQSPTAQTSAPSQAPDAADAPADASPTTSASTSAANLHDTYVGLVASNASGLGHIAESADKTSRDGDADGAQLSTDDFHDAFASIDDVETDDNDDTDGPLPSRPAPTDDDEISDIVSISSNDDDSAPAATTTSSEAPQASAASTLPTQYAFVTAGDSSQRAEKELVAYAQEVSKAIYAKHDALPSVNGIHTVSQADIDDKCDIDTLLRWAQALQKKSDDAAHFIIIPKSTLDTALTRLKALGAKYCTTKCTLKAETNYTNPKGMGSIDTFDMPALAPANAPQAAASTSSAHRITDDNDNDDDDDWTADEEDEEWVNSQAADQADAVHATEYSLIEDEESLLAYAQGIKAGIEAKLAGMSDAEKLLWQETVACDFNDTAEIISWVTALRNNKAAAIPTDTIDRIIKRLHQLALVYSKKDRTILPLEFTPDPTHPEAIFEREINIYSPEDTSGDSDSASSSGTSGSSNDDDGSTSESSNGNGEESSSYSSDIKFSSPDVEYAGIENTELLLSYAKQVNNDIYTLELAKGGIKTADYNDALEIYEWAQSLHEAIGERDDFIGIPKATLDKVLNRLHQLAKQYSQENKLVRASDWDQFAKAGLVFGHNISLTADIPTTDLPTANLGTAATDKNDNDSDESSSWSADIVQSSGATPLAGTENLEGIHSTELFVKYANQVATAILKKADHPVADYNDAHAICQWAESMHKNTCKQAKSIGVDSAQLDNVLKRLHELARKYHKENRWVKASGSTQFKTSGLVFVRDITITPADTPETPKAPLPTPGTGAATSAAHEDNDDDDNDASSSSDDSESKTDSKAQGDTKKSDTNTQQPQKADNKKSQSDGSTSDDEEDDDDDDTSSLSSENNNAGKGPKKPVGTPNKPKTPPVTTSSFTGNIFKLVKNKLVLTGGAVAAAIWYWQYYYAQDEDGADQPVSTAKVKQEKPITVAV